MDDARFDAFARAMVTASSRRAVLGLGLGFSAFSGPIAVADVNARKHKKHKKKKKCKGTTKKCGKKCIATSKCCTDGDCPIGTGQNCLVNGGCGTSCSGASCPMGCSCSSTEDGLAICRNMVTSCDLVPQACSSTADCGQGQACFEICAPPNPNRCVSLCTL